MSTAKDCKLARTPWMRAALVASAAIAASGCSTMSGLRSIGTERPSFLTYWIRGKQGSPAPGTDRYAQNMRAARSREALDAEGGERTALANRESDEGPDGPRSASNDSDAESVEAGKRPAGSNGPAQDRSIRVTLGPLEPLRTSPAGVPPADQLASTAPSHSWQAGADRQGSRVTDEPPGKSDSARNTHDARPAHGDSLVRADTGVAILAQAEAKLAALATYQVKLRRVERVGADLLPQEEVLVSVRRDPRAVRLEWEDGPSKGREVIYSTEIDPRTLFVHMAASAFSLPAMKIAVDSPLVTKNSRHSITEAGFETILANLRAAVKDSAGRQPSLGELSYRGLETPPGFDKPCHKYERRTRAGDSWTVFLDPQSLLPCYVVAEDSAGRLLERNIYRELLANPGQLASADAFQPDKRWGESQGVLSRLARAAGGSLLPGASHPTTR
jgi:hypothetical protein